jgi:amino acid adenylation domain-containing protein
MPSSNRPFRLPHLLTGSAESDPDRVAIVDGDRRVTYGELDRESTCLASWLIEDGVRPGDRVGLFLPKCAEAIVALFGIMEAGAVYVPIDAGAPVARAVHIVRDCGIGRVVTNVPKGRSLAGAVSEAGIDLKRLVVGAKVGGDGEETGEAVDWSDVVSGARSLALPAGTERDLAYILYTSGSTGPPKGVMISHRASLTFVDWAHDELDLSAEDVVSSHAPLHFDLSIFDVFATLKAGGTVILIQDSISTFPILLTRAIEEHRITVWYSVPSALILMLERGKLAEADVGSLRTVLFAGEVFPTPYLRRLRTVTDARLYNLFGPTETNVCTFYEVVELPEDDAETIPIGAPIANYEVLSLDGEARPVEGTEAGELYARGPGLMSGYWGDPGKTDASLVQNPLHDDYPDPVYRTGDMVRLDDRGRLRFLGRRDHQVKVRGYRIELGEIEAAIYTHPAVGEAVAVVAGPEGERTIVVVVVPVDGGSLTGSEVREHCLARIPRYMVPDSVVVTDRLPHTSTGKIDRQEVARGLSAP